MHLFKPNAPSAIAAVLTALALRVLDFGILASIGIAIVVWVVVNAVAAKMGFEPDDS
jgi:hypothetical protein